MAWTLGTPEDRVKCYQAARLLPAPKLHYVITHKGCPDGIGAAYLIGAPTIFVDPGVEVSEEVLSKVANKNVIMIDIAPANDNDFEKYDRVARQFLVLDHHVSNISKYDGRPNFLGCEELSGVSAAYYYCCELKFPERTKQVVKYIHERDLWSWSGSPEEIRQSKAFSLALGSVIKTIASESGVKFIHQTCTNSDMFDLMMEQGMLSMDDIDNKTARLKLLVERYTLFDHNVAVIDMTDHSDHKIAMNEAGNTIAEDLGCIVMYVTRGSGNVYCSLRGKDCLALALKFDGGGHANAAGFTLSPESYANLGW